jgi:hypothetical protein
MTDIRFPISGNIRIWWTPINGFANPAAPTLPELTASLDISDAVSWNDKDFGVQASNTTNDPAITAKGNVQSRGAAQYGGTLSLYYAKDRTDTSNKYQVVETALGQPGTLGYLTVRVDGEELLTTTGTANNPGTQPAAGDLVTVFRVETAGYANAITGEEAFRYSISFLSKGFVKTVAIVRTNATPVAPVVAGAATLTIAAKFAPLTATLLSRKYTRGVEWRTSTPTLASISRNGVVTAIAAGAASFTAVDLATNTPSVAKAITIS